MSRPVRSVRSAMELFTQRKMAALLLLGFSSGLPLYPVTRTLQAWMSVENVDLTTIGLWDVAVQQRPTET